MCPVCIASNEPGFMRVSSKYRTCPIYVDEIETFFLFDHYLVFVIISNNEGRFHFFSWCSARTAGTPTGSVKVSEAATTSSSGKTENVLPAYCNPPNPCPIGYTGKFRLLLIAVVGNQFEIQLCSLCIAEDGCLEEFENTAAFSREYQAAQDCMCDTEHMASFDFTISNIRFLILSSVCCVCLRAVWLSRLVAEPQKRQEPSHCQHGRYGYP